MDCTGLVCYTARMSDPVTFTTNGITYRTLAMLDTDDLRLAPFVRQEMVEKGWTHMAFATRLKGRREHLVYLTVVDGVVVNTSDPVAVGGRNHHD